MLEDTNLLGAPHMIFVLWNQKSMLLKQKAYKYSWSGIEQCHEKTCFMPYANNKAQISLHIRAVWPAPLFTA